MSDEEKKVIEAAQAWRAEFQLSGLSIVDLGPAAQKLVHALDALDQGETYPDTQRE